MIQFFIVLIVVGAVVAHFFGPEAAIKTGPVILDYWLLAALASLFLSPLISLLKWFLYLRKKFLKNKSVQSSGR